MKAKVASQVSTPGTMTGWWRWWWQWRLKAARSRLCFKNLFSILNFATCLVPHFVVHFLSQVQRLAEEPRRFSEFFGNSIDGHQGVGNYVRTARTHDRKIVRRDRPSSQQGTEKCRVSSQSRNDDCFWWELSSYENYFLLFFIACFKSFVLTRLLLKKELPINFENKLFRCFIILLTRSYSQTFLNFLPPFAGKVCSGLGTAASNIHKDIYKSARLALTDRAMPVRAAAAECLMVSHFNPVKSRPKISNAQYVCSTIW